MAVAIALGLGCGWQGQIRVTLSAAKGPCVGSFLDCMASSNPICANSGRSECHWTTNGSFSGWHIDNPTATAYPPILGGIGFLGSKARPRDGASVVGPLGRTV
jgi:hypothetical protein